MGPRGEAKIQLCSACPVAQLSVQPDFWYLIISQDQRDQSYSTVKTTSTAVTVNNLKPGTLYIFQIRTSSSPDYGNYSPSIEVETLAECKCWQGSSSLTHAPADVRLFEPSRGDAAAPAPDAPGFVEQHLFLWFCRSGSKSRYFPGLAFNCIFLFDFNKTAAAGPPVLEVSVLTLLSAASVRAASLWLLSGVETGDSLCSSTCIAQESA